MRRPGDPAAACSCSPQRLAAFRDKLSRALLDRFDLVVTVPRPRAEELAAGPAEPSAPVRERVGVARARCAAPAQAHRRGRGAPRAAPSSACRCRVVAARASREWREPPLRSRARTRSCSSTSPRRSRIARRRSSTRERARAASFAAVSDTHLVGEPRSAASQRSRPGSTRGAELERLVELGFRSWRAPTGLPAATAGDPRSAAGPLSPRRSGGRAARPAGGRDRRRSRLLAVRTAGRAPARPGARRGRPRRRQRPARGVDAEAHRGALEAAANGRRARLRHPGRSLRAETLYRATIGAEPRTPEEVAADFGVPLAASTKRSTIAYTRKSCCDRNARRCWQIFVPGG